MILLIGLSITNMSWKRLYSVYSDSIYLRKNYFIAPQNPFCVLWISVIDSTITKESSFIHTVYVIECRILYTEYIVPFLLQVSDFRYGSSYSSRGNIHCWLEKIVVFNVWMKVKSSKNYVTIEWTLFASMNATFFIVVSNLKNGDVEDVTNPKREK